MKGWRSLLLCGSGVAGLILSWWLAAEKAGEIGGPPSHAIPAFTAPAATPSAATNAQSTEATASTSTTASTTTTANPVAAEPAPRRPEPIPFRRDAATEAFLAKVDRNNEVHGILVGPDGGPLERARIVARRSPGRGYELQDFAFLLESEPVAEGISNNRGEFRIRVPRGQVVDLHITAAGLPRTILPNLQAGEFAAIQMQAGSVLHGRVLEADGSPVAAVVRGYAPGAWILDFEIRTGANGSFAVENLVPGNRFIEILPLEGGGSIWKQVSLEPGSRETGDFTLPEALQFEGRLLDGRTGRPVAHASVSRTWTFQQPARTDAEGRFRLRGNREEGMAAVLVDAPGFARLEHVFVEGAGSAVLELKPGRRVWGRVFNEAGQPLEGAYLAAAGRADTEGLRRTDWRATRSDADGRFVIEDLRADVAHTLFVLKEGYGTVLHEFPEVVDAGGESELGDVVLPRAGTVAGRVTNAEGRGMGRVPIEITGWNRDRARWNANRHPGVEAWFGRRTGRTDDQGRFRFTDLAPGDYTIRPVLTRQAEVQGRRVALQSAEIREGIHFDLSSSGLMAGLVLDPAGTPVAGADVYLQPEEAQGGMPVVAGTGVDGSFRIEGLEPGRYTLAVQRPAQEGSSAREFAATVQAGIASGSDALEIVLQWAEPISGVVRDQHGAALAGAEVRAISDEGRWVTRDRTDESGRFRLPVPKGTVVDLQVIASEEGASPQTWPAVTSGTEGLELRLSASR